MTITRIKQQPLKLGRIAKHDVRTQFGAVPWQIVEGTLQILLVTARKSGRWGVPKGWPADGATPAEAAAREAWEEAGATGIVSPLCIGLYSHEKKAGRERLPCVVALFPLHVLRLSATYPEHAARKRRWVAPGEAAGMVANPELARLLRDFDPGAPAP